MKIVCPHCKQAIDVHDAVYRPAKEKFNWYEFTQTFSYCALCNKRYPIEISIVGILIIAILISSAFVILYLGFWLIPALLSIILIYVLFTLPMKFGLFKIISK